MLLSNPARYVPALLAALALSGCAGSGRTSDAFPTEGASWTASTRYNARAGRAAARGAVARPVARTAATAAAEAPEPAAEAAPEATATVAPRRAGRVRAGAPTLAGASAVAATLRAEGREWIGVPYHFGGESRRGIDCSAFTRALMQQAFGHALPRNTTLQVQEGEPVSKGELRPGDLVFFRRGGTRHVGVFLGEGEFIHASSSRGVTVSRLDEEYYTRHYWTARRVLEGPAEQLYASAPRPRRLIDRIADVLSGGEEAEAEAAAEPEPAPRPRARRIVEAGEEAPAPASATESPRAGW